MRGVLSLIVSILFFSCQDQLTSNSNIGDSSKSDTSKTTEKKEFSHVINGDARLNEYLPLLKDKTVGLVVNQSSIIGVTHLIDTLIESNINIQKIFAPEHGIRGKADAGEKVDNGKDNKTGVDIISLYGSHKKPTKEDLSEIDVVVFDLQDVGIRFYTYISTMHYVMEACAENNIQVIVLDRPNPNGDYVAGPVLEKEYKSFVGMHPIPIVHGLTVGELANMINDEKWLEDSLKANVTVIPCLNYTHDSILPLTVKPSPNLPTLNSIRWYPSLCLLEPTSVSVGRGTYTPFEVFGSPLLDSGQYKFSFEPKSIDGMSKYPKHQDLVCYGRDLSSETVHLFSFNLLVETYSELHQKEDFFSSKNFFFKLCGTKKVFDALVAGKSSQEIANLFQTDLTSYKTLRKKYLLYPE